MARLPRLYRVVGVWSDGRKRTRNYLTPEAAYERRDNWLGRHDTIETDGTGQPDTAARVTVTPSYPVSFPSIEADRLDIPDMILGRAAWYDLAARLGIKPEAVRSITVTPTQIAVEYDPDPTRPGRASASPRHGSYRSRRTDMRWIKRAGIAALVAAVVALLGSPSAALAAGSDGPTPYTVTPQGVQLPDGVTFPEGGHVNYRTTLTTGGVHFDPNNGQPGGAYIGQSFLPITLAPGECITWVQVSLYNEHYGEGGQPPVCAPPAEPEPPTFTPYEVCATWLINAPAPEVWPGQSILSRECGYLPPAECAEYRVQTDEYWIRDAEDEAYWLALTVINSPADDAPLEPHDYAVVTIPAKDCTPEPEPEPQPEPEPSVPTAPQPVPSTEPPTPSPAAPATVTPGPSAAPPAPAPVSHPSLAETGTDETSTRTAMTGGAALLLVGAALTGLHLLTRRRAR